jgi:hypothetical protein
VARYWLAVAVGVCALSIGCENSSSSPPAPKDYGLIQAKNPDCQVLGRTIAAYLDTGRPTSYDITYGTQRQQVLGLSGEPRAVYIRQVAGASIQKCDEQGSAPTSPTAAPSPTSKAAAEQKWVYTCEHLAGTAKRDTTNGTGPNGWTCLILYHQYSEGDGGGGGEGTFQIPIDTSGNLMDAPAAEKRCAGAKALGWGDWWHPDTHVCAIGSGA